MSLDFDILDQIESNLRISRVGIVEFSESDKYCNRPLYPRQKIILKIIFGEDLENYEWDMLRRWDAGNDLLDISPCIEERIGWLQDHHRSHMSEVIFIGGRRSGKGYMTGIGMAKVMYDTWLLQDPGDYYEIDKTKNITFDCLAASEQQAKENQFADFIATVEGCAAFKNIHSLETEFRVQTVADQRQLAQLVGKGKRINRDYARLRGDALAANAGTFRGRAAMVVTVDEMAHMMVGESKASPDQIYTAAQPSLAQFRGDGMMWLNSSPATQIGKFHERHELAMKTTEDGKHPIEPTLFTIRFPSWASYDEWWRDPGRRFTRPLMYSPDWNTEDKFDNGEDKFDDEGRAMIAKWRLEEEADPDSFKVEYRAHWAAVVDAYLRPEMVDRMFGGVPTGYDERDNLVLSPYQSDYGEGAHNYHRYVAHLDPSSTTAGFGFAMGHIEEFTDKNGFGSEHVVFDIVKRWKPEDFRDRVINWEPIMEELVILADIFRPVGISFDQYQSHAPIQDLRMRLAERGISCRITEVTATAESNWKRAETFKTALYQGLIHAPNMGSPVHGDGPDQEWAALELKYLQVLNTASRFPKVDRQTAGPVQTKDIADCMMAVTHHLIGNTIQRRIAEQLSAQPIQMGAPGGYPLGGWERSKKIPPQYQQYYSQRQGDQLKTGPGRRSGRSGGGSRLRGITPNRSRGR